MSKKNTQGGQKPKENSTNNWEGAQWPGEGAGQTIEDFAAIGGESQYTIPPGISIDALSRPFSPANDILSPAAWVLAGDGFKSEELQTMIKDKRSLTEIFGGFLNGPTSETELSKLNAKKNSRIAALPLLYLSNLALSNLDISPDNSVPYIANSFISGALPDLLAGEFSGAFGSGVTNLVSDYLNNYLDDSMGPPVRDENGIQQVNSNRILAKTAISFVESLKDGPISTILSTTSGFVSAITYEMSQLDETSLGVYMDNINDTAASVSSDYAPALDGDGYEAYQTVMDVVSHIPAEPFSAQDVVYPDGISGMFDDESLAAYIENLSDTAAQISEEYAPVLEGDGYEAYQTIMDVASKIPLEPTSPQDIVFPTGAPGHSASRAAAMGSLLSKDLGAKSSQKKIANAGQLLAKNTGSKTSQKRLTDAGQSLAKDMGAKSAQKRMADAGQSLAKDMGAKNSQKKMADRGVQLGNTLLNKSKGGSSTSAKRSAAGAPLTKVSPRKFSTGTTVQPTSDGGWEHSSYENAPGYGGHATYSMPAQGTSPSGGAGAGNISVSVTGNQFSVRDEEDIDRIAKGLAEAIQRQVELSQ